VIRKTGDPRGFAERWATGLIVLFLASMIGVRACSVHLRSRAQRQPAVQSAEQIADVARPLDDGTAGAPFALSGDPFSAFTHALCAWNEIRLDASGCGGSVVVGDLHNNASRRGEIRLVGHQDIYGAVTSAGAIDVGSADGGPTTVRGSITGEDVIIRELSEVRDFIGLDEWSEGIDLNGDGDLDDFDFGDEPALVRAARKILCGDEALVSGRTDIRIADGTRAVEIGRVPTRVVARVYPDFRAYYETASGLSSYPPDADHVVSDVPGDGQAHYFASASAFRSWINSQDQTDVLCWRCGGDGAIDPDEATPCPDCEGGGNVPAVEIAGIFYIDDETLDLSAIETHLVVHGTFVIAKGSPYRWPARSVETPGATAAIEHRPEKGAFVLSGPTRMHFTLTPRSDREGGPYAWRHREIRSGADRQTVASSVPEDGRALGEFPAIIAASEIVVGPRSVGFARHPGDVGDEAVTILHGVLYAGGELSLGGRGGWKGEPIVFREEDAREEDDILDESVLRIDLNDDGDVFDRLRLADVSDRPVIPVSKGCYHVDINNDGVLNTVVIGEDYGEFFAKSGYAPPILIHHSGSLVADAIHLGAQCAVHFEAVSSGSVAPVGFFSSHPQRKVAALTITK
jgi:hypothetical protein